MKFVCLAVLCLASVMAGDKAERAVRPAHSDVGEVVLVEATVFAMGSLTDFECLDLGPFDAQCWTRDGVEICAEGIGSGLEIIEAGDRVNGDRALGWVSKCFSDAIPMIRLEFSTLLHSIQFEIASVPGATEEVRSFRCWDGGDPLTPNVDAGQGDPTWIQAIAVYCEDVAECGMAWCEVSGGSILNIRTTELGL